VYGVDGRIGIRDAWTLDWWGAASGVPGPDGNATAYSARLGYETGAWSNVARLIQVGSDFDPQVGFLNRRGGYRYVEAGVQWKKRFPSIPIVKQWIPHVNYRGYYRLDGEWQEGRIHLDLTEVELANGGRIGPEVNVEHQGLQQPFAIASNVTLPVGSYDYTSVGWDLTTNPARRCRSTCASTWVASTTARGGAGPRRWRQDTPAHSRLRCTSSTTMCAWTRGTSRAR